MALVSRLLRYDGSLTELFELLKLKLSNEDVKLNGQIQNLVSQLNEEARGINDLNVKFNGLMDRFDGSIAQ